MTDPSRPVRAIAAVLGGWVVVRTAVLWPSGATVPVVVDNKGPLPVPRIVQPLTPADIWEPLPQRNVAHEETPHKASVASGPSIEIVLDAPEPDRSSPPVMRTAATERATILARPGPEALPALPVQSVKRFSGSTWALSRTDGSAGLANGGQLGGSQIGARVFYTPGPKALALTARVSAPLGTVKGREASLGIALRGQNLGLIVEQRFALNNGGHDAPSVTAYGGVSEVPIAKGVRLNGYAQAGVVGVKNPQGFVDGAVSVETTVAEHDRSRLSVGLALSGGAQPSVQRLDIGPQIVARVPVGDTAVRVTAEWRQRIAGNATPDSGPAITVGFDF